MRTVPLIIRPLACRRHACDKGGIIACAFDCKEVEELWLEKVLLGALAPPAPLDAYACISYFLLSRKISRTSRIVNCLVFDGRMDGEGYVLKVGTLPF
jgi:hypothetical protein